MENLKKLDEILLSGKAQDLFPEQFHNDHDFENWLLGILPEVKDCDGFDQNSKWHPYDVLTHILKSVDVITERSSDLPADEKRLLAYIMFLHDIGKPRARTTYMLDGKIKSSFRCHPEISSEIAERALPSLGFSREDVESASLLILKHDCLMGEFNDKNICEPLAYSDAAVNGVISFFDRYGNGKKFAEKLFRIIYADNMAQNQELTKNIALAAEVCRRELAGAPPAGGACTHTRAKHKLKAK